MLLKFISFLFVRPQQRRVYRRRSFHVWDNSVEDPYGAKDLLINVETLPQAKVAQVIDGDTVIVIVDNKPVKIRLDAIDCPEHGQDWGDIAKYGLIKLIGGQYVHLETHGIDDYNRTLATILVWDQQKGTWLNVNERMVTLGHAWVMRRYYKHLPKDSRHN